MVRNSLDFKRVYEEGVCTGIRVTINQKGEFTYIDEEDFHILQEKEWRWKSPKQRYVVRGIRMNGKYNLLYLHREILLYHGWAIPKGNHVDHKNHNKLDNRKRNLRVVTPSQNQANRRRSNKKSDGYKGVRLNKRTGMWEARIYFDNKYMFLGSYPNAKMAAHFYNEAAKQIHGEYAKLNDI